MPDEIKEPAEVIEEKKYSEKEWKGLLGDKQSETKARQKLEATLAAKETYYEAELKDLQAKLAQKESASDENYDPEDVVSIALLNKKIASLEKKLVDMYTKEKTEMTKAEKDKLFEKSLKKAKEKYSEEKTGKGLSFDEVSEGTTRMVKENKVYGDLIFNDPDPAERAYQIGLLDPVIAKRYETYKKTLPPEGVTSKEGLKGTTVPAGFYSQEYVKKMAKTPGWIKEHLAEIQESQKKWTK